MKTLYIIGAGASTEVGLPLGSELLSPIANSLALLPSPVKMESGDYHIWDAINEHVSSSEKPSEAISELLEAANFISKNIRMAISIDNFIDSHREDENIALCGKLAIARCILEKEHASTISLNRRGGPNALHYVSLKNTYFMPLFQRLVENCNFADLPKRLAEVAFIVFNYDRCLEHFLFHAIKDYYGRDDGEVAQLLNDMKVIHPYGQVGALPWQGRTTSVAYGAQPNQYDLLEIASQLLTFTESSTDSASPDEMHKLLLGSQRIVFLGFAFHDRTQRLLGYRYGHIIVRSKSSTRYRHQSGYLERQEVREDDSG